MQDVNLRALLRCYACPGPEVQRPELPVDFLATVIAKPLSTTALPSHTKIANFVDDLLVSVASDTAVTEGNSKEALLGGGGQNEATFSPKSAIHESSDACDLVKALVPGESLMEACTPIQNQSTSGISPGCELSPLSQGSTSVDTRGLRHDGNTSKELTSDIALEPQSSSPENFEEVPNNGFPHIAMGVSSTFACSSSSDMTGSEVSRIQPSMLNVGESGSITTPRRIRCSSSLEFSSVTEEVAQLQASVDTLKLRLRERDKQKHKLSGDLVEAHHLTWEHQRAAEHARQVLREVVVGIEGEKSVPEDLLRQASELQTPESAPRRPLSVPSSPGAADLERAAQIRKLSVREIIEEREAQLNQVCSALAEARSFSSMCWRAAEERLQVVRQLELREGNHKVLMATAHHPAGDINFGRAFALSDVPAINDLADSKQNVLVDMSELVGTFSPTFVESGNKLRNTMTSLGSLKETNESGHEHIKIVDEEDRFLSKDYCEEGTIHAYFKEQMCVGVNTRHRNLDEPRIDADLEAELDEVSTNDCVHANRENRNVDEQSANSEAELDGFGNDERVRVDCEDGNVDERIVYSDLETEFQNVGNDDSIREDLEAEPREHGNSPCAQTFGRAKLKLASEGLEACVRRAVLSEAFNVLREWTISEKSRIAVLELHASLDRQRLCQRGTVEGMEGMNENGVVNEMVDSPLDSECSRSCCLNHSAWQDTQSTIEMPMEDIDRDLSVEQSTQEKQLEVLEASTGQLLSDGKCRRACVEEKAYLCEQSFDDTATLSSESALYNQRLPHESLRFHPFPAKPRCGRRPASANATVGRVQGGADCAGGNRRSDIIENIIGDTHCGIREFGMISASASLSQKLAVSNRKKHERLASCGVLRMRLAPVLEPADHALKASAMDKLKIGVGAHYASICLQSKMRSFTARQLLLTLRDQARGRRQSHKDGGESRHKRARSRSNSRGSNSSVVKSPWRSHHSLHQYRQQMPESNSLGSTFACSLPVDSNLHSQETHFRHDSQTQVSGSLALSQSDSAGHTLRPACVPRLELHRTQHTRTVCFQEEEVSVKDRKVGVEGGSNLGQASTTSLMQEWCAPTNTPPMLRALMPSQLAPAELDHYVAVRLQAAEHAITPHDLSERALDLQKKLSPASEEAFGLRAIVGTAAMQPSTGKFALGRDSLHGSASIAAHRGKSKLQQLIPHRDSDFPCEPFRQRSSPNQSPQAKFAAWKETPKTSPLERPVVQRWPRSVKTGEIAMSVENTRAEQVLKVSRTLDGHTHAIKKVDSAGRIVHPLRPKGQKVFPVSRHIVDHARLKCLVDSSELVLVA